MALEADAHHHIAVLHVIFICLGPYRFIAGFMAGSVIDMTARAIAAG